MDKSRSIHGIQNYAQSSSDYTEDSEYEEMDKRLANLLNRNRHTNNNRNIFVEAVASVPKIRRSVVARAVDNGPISSTPYPQKKNEFIKVYSPNISSINSDSNDNECPNANLSDAEKRVTSHQQHTKKQSCLINKNGLEHSNKGEHKVRNKKRKGKTVKKDDKQCNKVENSDTSSQDSIKKNQTKKSTITSKWAKSIITAINKDSNKENDQQMTDIEAAPLKNLTNGIISEEMFQISNDVKASTSKIPVINPKSFMYRKSKTPNVDRLRKDRSVNYSQEKQPFIPSFSARREQTLCNLEKSEATTRKIDMQMQDLAKRQNSLITKERFITSYDKPRYPVRRSSETNVKAIENIVDEITQRKAFIEMNRSCDHETQNKKGRFSITLHDTRNLSKQFSRNVSSEIGQALAEQSATKSYNKDMVVSNSLRYEGDEDTISNEKLPGNTNPPNIECSRISMHNNSGKNITHRKLHTSHNSFKKPINTNTEGVNENLDRYTEKNVTDKLIDRSRIRNTTSKEIQTTPNYSKQFCGPINNEVGEQENPESYIGLRHTDASRIPNMTCKEIQTSQNDTNELHGSAQLHNKLSEIDFMLFETMKMDKSNISDFSMNDTYNSILADNSGRQIWRMSCELPEKNVPRRSSVHLNFLKSAYQIENEKTIGKMQNEEADETVTEGTDSIDYSGNTERSFFIYRQNIFERHGIPMTQPSATEPTVVQRRAQYSNRRNIENNDEVFFEYVNSGRDSVSISPNRRSQQCIQMPFKYSQLEEERRKKKKTQIHDNQIVKAVSKDVVNTKLKNSQRRQPRTYSRKTDIYPPEVRSRSRSPNPSINNHEYTIAQNTSAKNNKNSIQHDEDIVDKVPHLLSSNPRINIINVDIIQPTRPTEESDELKFKHQINQKTLPSPCHENTNKLKNHGKDKTVEGGVDLVPEDQGGVELVPDVTNKSNDINVFTTPKPVTAKRKFKKNKNNVSEHSLVTRSRSVLLNEKDPNEVQQTSDVGTKHLNDVSVSPDTKRVTTKRNYKKKENKNVSVQSSLSTSHSISKIDQADSNKVHQTPDVVTTLLNDVSVIAATEPVATKRNSKKKENKNVSVQSSLATSHCISKIDHSDPNEVHSVSNKMTTSSSNLFAVPKPVNTKRKTKKISNVSELSSFKTSTSNMADESTFRRSTRVRRPVKNVWDVGHFEVRNKSAYKLFKEMTKLNTALQIIETSPQKRSSKEETKKTRKPKIDKIIDNTQVREDITKKNLKVVISKGFNYDEERCASINNNKLHLVPRNLESELQAPSVSKCFEHPNSDIQDDVHLRTTISPGKIKRRRTKEKMSTKLSRVLTRRTSNCRFDNEIVDEQPVNCGYVANLGTEYAEEDIVNVFCNDKLVSVPIVDDNAIFKPVDEVFMTEFSSNANGKMGMLKIPPGKRKPFRISRRQLIYCVLSGIGRVQLQASIENIKANCRFAIPAGTEYSITNGSTEEDITLFCVVTPSMET